MNSEQLAAVESKAARRLVVAGPGSGKTRTLVAAVAHEIITNKVLPSQIIVVTYTNAAALEVETRLFDMAGGSVKSNSGDKERWLDRCFGFIGTLHSFMLRLLAEHHDLVGLPPSLSVVGNEQVEGMVVQVMADTGTKAPMSKVVELLAMDRYYAKKPLALYSKPELVAVDYHSRMRAAGLLDFDSILHYGLEVVKEASELQWPYRCLFVDEFQDASDQDAAIYDAMPCARKFYVGDPDQAIYRFRGGNVAHINSAEPDGTEVCWMETNYRSGSVICDAAQRIIEHNSDRLPKRTVAARAGGSVEAVACETAADELNYVLGEIVASSEKWAADVRHKALNSAIDSKDIESVLRESEIAFGGLQVPISHYADIAVLARTNRLAQSFAEFLSARGVPVARKKFEADAPDWAKAKLLLTVLANPWNNLAVCRYLALMDETKSDAVRQAAAKAMVGMNELMGFPFGKGDCSPSSLDADLGRHDLTQESRQRIADAAKGMRGRWTLNDLLVRLADPVDAVATEGVTCCTMHAAKGRECGTVFLVGCEEGTVPSGRKDTDVSEERRLFYVAMTRAKDRLVVTWCEKRPDPFRYGTVNLQQPSRFLAEAGIGHKTI